MKITITIIVVAIAFIGAILALKARSTDKSGPVQVTSPCDLNTPVTNPKLIAAMKDDLAAPTDTTKRVLASELNRAVFLIATLMDDASVKPTEDEGQITIEKGSIIKFLTAESDSGGTYLPLFTDWGQIRKYTELEVNGMVTPAKEAWRFVLQSKTYAGIIVNPAGPSLPIDRNTLELLNQEE